MATTQTQVAHIWRRLGLGPAADDVDAGVSVGPQALINDLLSRPAMVSSAGNPNPWGFPAGTDYTAEAAYTGRMIELMAFGPSATGSGVTSPTYNPLQERVAWILQGLVVTGIIDSTYFTDLKDHVNLLRNSVFGTHKQLLLDVSTRPGMLKYLSGYQNTRSHPNQNYAREVMELFSIGRVHPVTGAANYTQGDVQEIARALTGWQYNWGHGTTFFSPSQWDPGVKTYRGQSLGAAKLPDVINALAAHPAWPYFIPKRFYRELVGFDPAPAVLESLAATFGPTGDLKALITAIANQPEFLSDQAIFSKVKQPVELIASAARLLGFPSLATTNFYLSSDLHTTINQHPLYAPNVAGWPRGDQWLGSGSMLAWSALAGRILYIGFNWNGVQNGPICPYIQRLFSEGPAATATSRLLHQAGLDNASATTQAKLIEYAAGGPWNLARAAGLIHLLFLSPEFLAC